MSGVHVTSQAVTSGMTRMGFVKDECLTAHLIMIHQKGEQNLVIERSTDGKQRVLSLSYGKDSMACLGAIEELGWTLDRIITADVWATDEIEADLPPMVEFKHYADKVILERYGIQVEHFYAVRDGAKDTFQKVFYTRRKGGKNPQSMTGWPMLTGCEALKRLKLKAIYSAQSSAKGAIMYLGIALDEPKRFHNLSDKQLSPLVEIGWTEADARIWCEKNDLLSPLYKISDRGGCFFCPKQRNASLRTLRKLYPDLWQLMLKWDSDFMEDEKTPQKVKTFDANGNYLRQFEERFQLEDEHLVDPLKPFKWKMLDEELNYKIF